MKKCENCNIEMVENTDLHTDSVGGVNFEEQIYLSYISGTTTSKNIFGKEREKEINVTKRVKARVCPNCGKVELFVDLESN